MVIRLPLHHYTKTAVKPYATTIHCTRSWFVTPELLNNLPLRALSTVTGAVERLSLYRMSLGRGKRTLATSLSCNNRLIIVFVSNKSEHNRLHVPVLF